MRSGQNYKPATAGTTPAGKEPQFNADYLSTEPLAAMFNQHDPACLKYAIFCIQQSFLKNPEALAATGMSDELPEVLNNLYGFLEEFDTTQGRAYVKSIITNSFPARP